MQFEMDQLMEMGMSEQRKTIALDILKELIKKHDLSFSESQMRDLVGNAIYMTDEFLKKINASTGNE